LYEDVNWETEEEKKKEEADGAAFR